MTEKKEMIYFKINVEERKLNCVTLEESLKTMQELVGGYIELAVSMPTSEIYAEESGIVAFDLYVNEEGLLNGEPEGFFQLVHEGKEYGPFAGNAFIVGSNAEGESVSVDALEMTKLKFGIINKENPEAYTNIVNHYKNQGFC